ncbi:MAG: amino acid permease [Rhodothermia bacterium]|nr:MAG: amino acid permease [Rhodothermia bacterium]
MPDRTQTKRLKKELGLLDVYAIATGATLSSGFFLLPGIAAVGAGPALPLSYLIAALFLLPGLMSAAELATAMPRSGGVYFFLDRSMGPLWGTMSGFGTWFSLILKTAFALLGVGAYLSIFFPDAPMTPIAAGFAITFGIVNLVGAKKSAATQVFLVIGLLLLLLWFSGVGILDVNASFFRGFLDKGASSIISTAGLVVVSYMGLTKIASVAEEIKNPVRNLPLGMFLSFATAIVVYLIGTSIMVGVISAEALAANGGDLTPVATVAEALVGRWGAVLMTIAAILAFSSVANAGILSSSRYPLAMGRDKLLPAIFSKLGKKKQTPYFSIVVTVGMIVLLVTVFNPVKVAKLASSFQLLMFAMSCIAVIVMRESRITSYDPGFRSPLYPWIQLIGIVAPVWLITQNGALSIVFTGGLMILGMIWYWNYARDRVDRRGAIFHVFERLGTDVDYRLEHEMRGHIKEKGLRPEDPFDAVVARSFVIDISADVSFEDVVGEAAKLLAERIPMTSDEIKMQFLEGTPLGVTPVTHGVALPHFTTSSVDQPEMVLVRSEKAIHIAESDRTLGGVDDEQDVKAIFFLVSPDSNPGQHLRILAQIATRVDEDEFSRDWAAAADEKELKQVLFRGEYFHLLELKTGTKTEHLIGRSLQEAHLPHGILIAVIRRDRTNIVPQGDTLMLEGDFLTIIGNPEDLDRLRKQYEED